MNIHSMGTVTVRTDSEKPYLQRFMYENWSLGISPVRKLSLETLQVRNYTGAGASIKTVTPNVWSEKTVTADIRSEETILETFPVSNGY